MIERLFANTVYVKIFSNRMELKRIESGKVVKEIPQEPYTTHRLLVGNFTSANTLLTRGVKKLHEGKWLSPSPIIVIHPMEKTEFGLSEVEDRALRELAIVAGARKVSIWVGQELSDSEVIEQATRA